MKEIAVQGICYDAKSSYARGPALAPPLIRKHFSSDASHTFAENGMDAGAVFEELGDKPIEVYEHIERVTSDNLKFRKRILTLGGDHSITYPVVKALSKRHKNFDILHIDAHTDLYDEFEGDRFSHACPFARIMETGCVSRLVQVGIRTLNPHQREQAEKFSVEIHEMKSYRQSDIRPFQQPIYLSLDMDGIDPAFAPGVSHREPGGLSSRQVIDLIHYINTPIIGADIVEYNPKKDLDGVTGVLAAKLMKEILAKMAESSPG